MSQNSNTALSRQEVNKILEQHFAQKKEMLTPQRIKQKNPIPTPDRVSKNFYGPLKQLSQDERKTKIEELDKATRGKIHEKTEDLPNWEREQERRYADKIIKDGTEKDLRDIPQSKFVGGPVKEKTPEKKDDQPQQSSSSPSPSQEEPPSEAKKSAFVDAPLKEQWETAPAKEDVIGSGTVDNPPAPPDQLPEETKPDHNQEQDLYKQYVAERENHPSEDHEQAPDEYKQYVIERENGPSESGPDKGKEQQKEHELEDR